MLKGKSIIELTDVNTKEKETYINDNIVTNAVPDLISLNPSALMYPVQTHSIEAFERCIFPISTKCYGGILLFQDRLEEDINKYIPKWDNQIIGYASNDVNPTEEKKRGSFNLTESGPIENGYKFVWDFSTSQANGRISSLSLTHFSGGKNYYGDDFGNASCLRINELDERTREYYSCRVYTCVVEANIEKNYLIAICPKRDKSIDIMKMYEPFSSVGLNDTITGFDKNKIEITNIPAQDFFDDSGRDSLYHNFFDGEDGYWYGFNSIWRRSGTILKRIKIKKDDLSTEINTWSFTDIQLFRIGSYPGADDDTPRREIFSTAKNGYLYALSYDEKSIYKININNPIDISKIELGFDPKFNGVRYCNVYIYNWGDRILGYNFEVNSKGEVIKTYDKSEYNGSLQAYICTPMIQVGPFGIAYGFYDGRLIKSLFLHTPYLGTINNLSSPILKTADKTMKITYTLTEEE